MAVVDPLSWIGPSVISAIVVFIALLSTRGLKMGDKTVSGSVKIEGLQASFEDMKKAEEKSFDRLEIAMDNRHEEVRKDLEKISDKVNKLDQKMALTEFRLTQLERTKNGGGKSAV